MSAPRLPGHLAFSLRGDVYVLADGVYRPLTSDGRSTQPALAPDGGSVVFTRTETIDGARVVDGRGTPAVLGFSRIVRRPSAGGTEEILVDGLRQRAANGVHQVSWYLGPAVSPDGGRLALTEDDGDGAADLEVIELGGTGRSVRLLSQGAQLADPSWSPDGSTLAVTSYNTDVAGLLLWKADGSGARRLSGLPVGEAYRPAFTPDGRWLLYTLRRGDASDVHAVELATGRDVALTTDGRSWNAVPSPDGAWIAYLRAERSSIDLWAMDLGGAIGSGTPQAPQRITRGEGIDGGSRPSWSR